MKLVKSAYRALEILERLAAAPDGLTFTEIMYELKLARSTTHELLKTLASSSYIRFDVQSKTYSLGVGALTLGIQYLRRPSPLNDAFDGLRIWLDRYEGATLQLGIRSGDRVIVVQESHSGNPTSASRNIGMDAPLTSSTLGKVLLSNASEDEVRRVWEENSGGKSADNLAEQWRSIYWELREVSGFGFKFEAHADGYSMAVPIYSRGGGDASEVEGAVSLHIRKDRASYESLKEICSSLRDLTLYREAAKSGSLVYISLPNFNTQKAIAYLDTFKEEFAGDQEVRHWLAVSANDDEWKQQILLELALEQLKPDCVVLSPVNAVNSDPLFRMLAGSDVPSICFQRPSRSRFVENYIGGDGFEQGVMQLEYIAKRLKGRGRVVVLEGDPYNENARNMWLGHQEVFQQHPRLQNVATIPVSLWSREEARQIIAEMLDSGQVFDAVVTGSDPMAAGVAEEFIKRKLAGKIILVGGDGDASAVELIRARRQHATVFQHPAEAASAVVRAVRELCAGSPLSEAEQRPILRDLPGHVVHIVSIPYTFYDGANIEELEHYWKDKLEHRK